MAINDNRNAATASTRQFGGNKGATSNANNTTADKPKAQLWINLGYTKTVIKDGIEVDEFVSLPQGIPVDTMDLKPATSRNDDFRNRELAQNALLKKIMERAATLAPGEDTLIKLEIQLRRVNADVVPTNDDQNQYIADFEL